LAPKESTTKKKQRRSRRSGNGFGNGGTEGSGTAVAQSVVGSMGIKGLTTKLPFDPLGYQVIIFGRLFGHCSGERHCSIIRGYECNK